MIHLGQSFAGVEPIPRRWLVRLLGIPDVHTRQKWSALWPQLARLPDKGLRILDAGCGSGWWSLELAARRPGWRVVGIDCEPTCLRTASAAAGRLGLDNVAFVRTEFSEFRAERAFDVVLSVCSAHYLAESGRATEVFRRMHSWLKPGGQVFFLGPRRTEETPFVSWLPRSRPHDVFTLEGLADCCAASGLDVEDLCGRVGRLGAIAKQLSWVRRPLGFSSCALYPIQLLLAWLDTCFSSRERRPTVMWLLIARAENRPQENGRCT